MIRFDLKTGVGWGRRCETGGRKSGLQGNEVTFPSSASENTGGFCLWMKKQCKSHLVCLSYGEQSERRCRGSRNRTESVLLLQKEHGWKMTRAYMGENKDRTQDLTWAKRKGIRWYREMLWVRDWQTPWVRAPCGGYSFKNGSTLVEPRKVAQREGLGVLHLLACLGYSPGCKPENMCRRGYIMDIHDTEGKCER